MKLESIEKLRNLHERGCGCVPDCINCSLPEELGEIADEIQAEINSHYMPPPVDADGAPWTKEDKTFAYFKEPYDAQEIVEYVYNVNDESWYIRGLSEGCTSEYYALHCVHVKPDPIKELLCEFALAIDPGADVDIGGAKTVNEYATKLREAVSANE